MKLKKYNRSTHIRHGVSGMPYFSITKKGVIRLNSKAQEILGLQIGDKINIYNDEEQQSDWFIEKTQDTDGLVMRNCNGGGIVCNGVTITKEIFKSLRLDKETSLSMRLAPAPIEDGSSIYAIFTLSSGRK